MLGHRLLENDNDTILTSKVSPLQPKIHFLRVLCIINSVRIFITRNYEMKEKTTEGFVLTLIILF